MESKLSKGIQSKLKVLGIYQIAGGIIGLALIVWIITGLTASSLILSALLLLATGLYAYSIYCGVLLIRKNISGLKHSLINQCLQLLSLSILGFTFQYISGIFLTVGLDFTNAFIFIFNLGISQWQITINGDKEPVILNFNLVALFLILFIEKLRKEINKERIDIQISSIGH